MGVLVSQITTFNAGLLDENLGDNLGRKSLRNIDRNRFWWKSCLEIQAEVLMKNSGGDLGENLGGKFLRKSRRTLPRILAGKPSRNLDENPGGHQLSENLDGKSLQESWRKSWREITAGILTEILAGGLVRTLAGNSGQSLDVNPGRYLVENPDHTDTFKCY